jgi:hypothetical protein
MLFSLEIPVIKLDGERNVIGHARIYYMYTPLQNRGSHGHNGMVVGFTTVHLELYTLCMSWADATLRLILKEVVNGYHCEKCKRLIKNKNFGPRKVF